VTFWWISASPTTQTDSTDRFMVVEVIISSGRPAGNRSRHCGPKAVRLFGERPTPRASGHPIRLSRGGAEPPALFLLPSLRPRGDRGMPKPSKREPDRGGNERATLGSGLRCLTGMGVPTPIGEPELLICQAMEGAILGAYLQ